jgi:hypothetical protein
LSSGKAMRKHSALTIKKGGVTYEIREMMKYRVWGRYITPHMLRIRNPFHIRSQALRMRGSVLVVQQRVIFLTRKPLLL